MKRLEKYRALRQPQQEVARSPEPMGADAGTETAEGTSGEFDSAFVVHQHHATQMHFDLRIEVEGTLLSFAVPKGLTLDPKVKHLAIRTEDHPLEYLDFEDVIPEGNYGAGPMIMWDRGRVHALGEPLATQLGQGKLDFVLHGFKALGRFSLVKLKKEKDG
jgi:bifunctional non-homologous end joining protein LigD